MFSKKETSDAVSPVIGVILLVAVTVALVALATVIVFDIGSDVSDSADAAVQLEQTATGDDGENVIQATVVRANNVQGFAFSGDVADTGDDDFGGEASNAEDEEGEFDASVGTVASALNLDEDDTISVVAELEDGTEEVLTSTTVR